VGYLPDERILGLSKLSAGWVASAAWAAANKATLDAFAKSQDDALAWMKANDAAAKQVLVKEFKLPEPVAANYPVTKWVSFDAKPEHLQPWIDPMKKVGDLPADLSTPTTELVYQS
jgi:NitT/TauT family transport system substrate-binding protein